MLNEREDEAVGIAGAGGGCGGGAGLQDTTEGLSTPSTAGWCYISKPVVF